jgi:hypothetical protein
MSLQTVLPFKLAVADESLTAHAGPALFGEYLRAMGVCGLIDYRLPRPGSAAGYSPSVPVLPLVPMLPGGGRTLTGAAQTGLHRAPLAARRVFA